MEPIQSAITGEEDLGDLAAPRQALAQFYRAFNHRDLAGLAANWADSEEAAMDNPLGGIARGWPAIRAVYEKLVSGAAAVRVEFHDYTIHQSGELFYAVGRERGYLMDGGAALPLAIRTSRVFRKIDGRWRQVHHHGSMDDPKLLARYQALVRSAALSGESARREQAAAGETFRDYARAFQSLRPAAVVSYFDLPFALIADGGVSALADAVALEAFLGRVMENLKARGFARSEIAELCAERLSEQLVAVSVRRSRRKADGSELERLGETYIFRRAGGAWKIAAAIVHEPLVLSAA